MTLKPEVKSKLVYSAVCTRTKGNLGENNLPTLQQIHKANEKTHAIFPSQYI